MKAPTAATRISSGMFGWLVAAATAPIATSAGSAGAGGKSPSTTHPTSTMGNSQTESAFASMQA